MTHNFQQRVSAALEDTHLRAALARSTAQLRRARLVGYAGPTEFAQLQQAARAIRQHTLANLPELLAQLEAQVIANGGVVYWAEDAVAASQYIVNLVRRDMTQQRRIVIDSATASYSQRAREQRPPRSGPNHTTGRVVKSRSTTGEEIGLNTALEAAGLSVTETQLGDYILQLAHDTPSHMVFPALHLRKEEVAQLFEQRLDMPQTLDVQAMAGMGRFKLRRELLQADVGLTGINFAVAETGTLVLVTNSGNERPVTSLPRIHVALMGIEKVVPTLEDLMLLLQMLSCSATGHPITSSVTLLNGPARIDESDGPEELHLIFLDNGRSALLQEEYGQLLACIRCGACLNSCPVYQEIGGHAYGGIHAGPVGSLLAPLMPVPPMPSPQDGEGVRGQRRQSAPAPRGQQPALDAQLRLTPFAELPHASSLCGACAEVCPVGIDLPRLLVSLRRDLNAAGRASWTERLGLRVWTWAMADQAHYRTMARFLATTGRLLGRRWSGRLPPPLSGWTGGRNVPVPARQPFRERWAAGRQEQL